MNKHSSTPEFTRQPAPPKHRIGWGPEDVIWDDRPQDEPYTPGKHAKPFAKRHPATPVEATPANVTPLFPAATVLDVAA